MKPLTEKTLELNIMAELAFLGRIAGFQPYFIGFSQLDEVIHGADTGFSAGALVGFYQFKRGYPKSGFFTFYINNNAPHFNQHKTLSQTDDYCGACRYVFPLIGTNQDVYHKRGNLLASTAFFSPHTFDPLVPAHKSHRIRMYLSGNWQRYSDFNKGDWKNIYGQLPKETQSLEKVLTQSPEVRREIASRLIQNLELPAIGHLMQNHLDADTASLRRLFSQRSSFCMVFDKD